MQWRANGFTEKAVASTVMLVGCSRVVNIRLHASTFKGLRRRLHSACHSAHRTARRGARPESTGKAAKGPRFHTVREGDKRRLRSGSNLWESRLCFALQAAERRQERLRRAEERQQMQATVGRNRSRLES